MPFVFNFTPVFAEWPRLLDGLLLTLGLSVAGIVLGTALGVGLAVARAIAPRPIGALIEGYVEVIRNTPFLIQLFIIFFALPPLGLRLSAAEASIVALTINLGAYATEIVRAGIESVHPSQIEAGQSLALTRLQVFRYVVLLPAL
ncbi:MAG: ABC transporter permease subunit, partial [Gemmatimonadaceae bacterium]|nr:ABC transporter permease subunit [Acetobacteraceae bacterium]